LAEGLRKRYGIHARAEGHEFVIERVEDVKRLPSYQAIEAADVRRLTSPSQNEEINEPPHVGSYETGDLAGAAAVKGVIDRLQGELKVIEKTGFLSYFL